MTAVPESSVPTTTTRRRLAPLVTAGIACLIGVALTLGGATLVISSWTQRDSAGYVTSDGEDYATPTYAFATQSLDVPMIGSGRLARGVLGKVRITSDSARPVFLGIARESDVASYLGSVNRAALSDSYKPRDATERGAGAPSGPPSAQDFWAASVSGAGKRALDWKLRDGHWVAVLMNTDGSRRVSARLRIGAEFPGLGWIGAGALAAGLLLAGGGFLLIRSSRRA
jgi:hypothetical protein